MSDDKLKIDRESLEAARNNTGLPTDEVVSVLEKDGLTLRYGELALLVRKQDYATIQQQVAGLPVEERPRVMASVDRSLRRAAKKFRRGKYTKETADHFYADLMLWNALKASAS